ncbi:MAG TPA: protein kinase [Terracidiphilus sp.]|jgi:serine/threonine-protein kinase|nr:protein kinase [Terracidiphilus sp.]
MKTCPVCDTPYPDQHVSCPTDGALLIELRELQPGHVVRGKYRIVQLLGHGGMGEVYQAEHLMLGGQVALKFLAQELSRNPQFIRRFRQEARVSYQLRHPNVVEVADLDQDEEGSLFIAMEYVPGPSLRMVVHHAPNGLPIERAVNIIRGVAAGLAAAHARGIVHRDIKPENVLLRTLADGHEQAKVLDFGIAAMTEGITNISKTHGLLLTPEYASPEQWRGTPAAELDGRTDLYALGVMFYEMLAGRTPFRAVNNEGWMFQHLQGIPEPLGKVRPAVARELPGLDALVMQMMARERENRPANMHAVLDELDRLEREKTTRRQTVVDEHSARARTVVEPMPSRPEPNPEPKPEPRPQPKPEPRPEPKPQPEPQQVVRPIISTPGPERNEEEEERESGEKKPAKGRKFFLVVLFLSVAIAILIPLWLANRPVTATPTLSPVGGTYAIAQPVVLSDPTPTAKIHYTLDGSEPSENSPQDWAGPIRVTVPSGATVRAIAVAPGQKLSAEVSGIYMWTTNAEVPAELQNAAPYDQGKYLYDHKQYAAARSLFSQACDGGEMRGCNYLGYMFAQGLGGGRNTEQARAIYQKACDQGTLTSCASLGTLYQEDSDAENARKYFQKACDGGLNTACTLLHDLQ